MYFYSKAWYDKFLSRVFKICCVCWFWVVRTEESRGDTLGAAGSFEFPLASPQGVQLEVFQCNYFVGFSRTRCSGRQASVLLLLFAAAASRTREISREAREAG